MLVLARTGGASFSGLILACAPAAFGRLVKVPATDTSSGGIQYSDGWLGPVHFDWGPEDIVGRGGPNSSVCQMDVPSRLAEGEGDSFSFSFRGISVQLVMSSRPDHAPFSVEYDGKMYTGDTYSQVVHCGAAWSSPVADVVGEHNVTCTNHPYRLRAYLELLSIQYDDGSPSLDTVPQSTSQSSAPAGQPTNTENHLSPGVVAGVAVGSVAFTACVILAAIFTWRRWRRTKREKHAVDPLPIAPSAPETTRQSLSKVLGTDEDNTRTLPTLLAATGAPGTRLADEDIDRIALRMNEMLEARAGLSVGGRESDAATSLPPSLL